MVMPNFLILGAANSGTTSLYDYLKQHPDIYMPEVKEPRFFAFEDEALKFCGPGDEHRNANSVTRLDEYRALFSGVTKEKAIGEASPPYLYIPKAAERIRHHIPNAKLIAILRNPADRAFSNFMHQRAIGYEPLADFSMAIEDEETRIKNNWSFIWHYRARGYYYKQIKRFMDIFPHENIRIYLYEDFSENNVALIQDIFRFLGVDDTFCPNVSIQHNPTGEPKSQFFMRFLRDPGLAKAIAKRLLPYSLRANLKSRLLARNTAGQAMPPDFRRKLLEDYRPDIAKLEKLLDRDLSVWLDR